jgi:KDO2-lipid IV(A) lauroyltransferase
MNWLDAALGKLTALVFACLRRTNPDRASDLCGAITRAVGPWLPASRIGRANLRAAYPDKDSAWIEQTLRGVWENLGRVGGEFIHLGDLWDYDEENPNTGRIRSDDVWLFEMLRDDGKPALCFTAHLANWELPAVAATRHGLPSAVVYRIPNRAGVAREIKAIRGALMGRMIATRREAVFEMASALEHGEHLGMLVDQRFTRGVEVTFFGQKCTANPTIARMARHFDCPVVGVHVVREPGNKFRVIGTPPLDLPRDAEGKIAVQPAMQMITDVVETWVRAHPEQWLWLHRRWRR